MEPNTPSFSSSENSRNVYWLLITVQVALQFFGLQRHGRGGLACTKPRLGFEMGVQCWFLPDAASVCPFVSILSG